MEELELEETIEAKLKLAEEYDNSEGVNSFYLDGRLGWLDKATRVGLAHSLNVEKEAGHQTTNLWFDGYGITIPIDTARAMLSALELYAKACYDVTQQHLRNIRELTDIEAVRKYNYTKGYPARPNFATGIEV